MSEEGSSGNMSGMISVVKERFTRNALGGVGERNWEGCGARKRFLIIDDNSHGASLLFCNCPLGPDTEAGVSTRQEGRTRGCFVSS